MGWLDVITGRVVEGTRNTRFEMEQGITSNGVIGRTVRDVKRREFEWNNQSNINVGIRCQGKVLIIDISGDKRLLHRGKSE
jgi:hypothetical protein